MVAKYKSVDADQNKDIVELQLDMVALQKDITYTKEKVNSIDHKLDTFIHSADKKYASKNIEALVNDHSKTISQINVKFARYIGYASGLVAIITFLINKFI